MRTTLPASFLRLESLVVLVAAVGLYFDADYAGWAFFAFLLAPDLSIGAYLAGPRVGAVVYNGVHTYAWPVALVAGGLLADNDGLPVQIGLIWAAHIAVDRLLGFGLKYPTAFNDTHLDRI
jgi:Domain of unknown function (DUF4260)